MDRVYFNITNRCNYECPFCCMCSSPRNTLDISFPEYQNVIKNCLSANHGQLLEIQLEGGEPTINKDFFLMVEYALSLSEVYRVIIDTNGSTIKSVLPILVEMSNRRKKDILIKLSDNAYIREKRKNVPEDYKNLISAIEFLEYISIVINLRAYSNEELNDFKKDYSLWGSKRYTKDFSRYVSAWTFNRYGRAKNENDLSFPIINKTVNEFFCISSDGKNFGEDLLKRAEHEESLTKI